MTIYLDSLILLNFLLDYLLLLLTGRIAGTILPRRRIALSAALGALYAASVIVPGWSILRLPITHFSVGILLVLLTYGSQRHIFRLILLFFALSAALGGGLYALNLTNSTLFTLHGTPVPLLDLRLILLISVLAYGLFSLLCGKLSRYSASEILDVSVYLEGQKARLTALLDSGNTLSDPMTGKPVLVAEAAALHPLLPPNLDLRDPASSLPTLSPPGRFRLLPYRAVGTDRGLLLALRVDSIVVNGKTIPSDLIALSPTPLSDGGGYQALIGTE